MNNELYHHGVSGMKWGKRNGPPYPLNSAGKSKLRKQRMASYGSSVTKGGEPNNPKKLSKKHKEDYKMHKTYNRQRAQKAVRRDVALAMVGGGAIGTAVGGPMSGLASMLASGLATTAFSSAINAGRNAISNSKYKKMLLESQEFEDAKGKGKEIIETKSDPAENMRNNQKVLESSGYKVDNDNLGGDFMTKKQSGVNVHIGIGDNLLANNEYMKAAKQLDKRVASLTSEIDEMAKKDAFIQEQGIKPIPNSHYVVIDGLEFGEAGFFGNDGHEFSAYFDPKTGKIQNKELMMNG